MTNRNRSPSDARPFNPPSPQAIHRQKIALFARDAGLAARLENSLNKPHESDGQIFNYQGVDVFKFESPQALIEQELEVRGICRTEVLGDEGKFRALYVNGQVTPTEFSGLYLHIKCAFDSVPDGELPNVPRLVDAALSDDTYTNAAKVGLRTLGFEV